MVEVANPMTVARVADPTPTGPSGASSTSHLFTRTT